MKLKKVFAVATAVSMTAVSLAGCGSAGTSIGTSSKQAEESEKDGKILWLSSLTSGAGYEAAYNYMEALSGELGYDFDVVFFGDDDAGTLNNVKNAMSDDVVGIVTGDGNAMKNILEEYPEVYVAGYGSDLTNVYDGSLPEVLENDHYLGTICDGHADGTEVGELYFNNVVENGYKKVAMVEFPSYAYPNQNVADETFRKMVEEYNAEASEEEKIEIMGESTVLEFTNLPDSWFLEEGHDDLDCIVSFCAGVVFVYPTLVAAKANGACAADTKMISGGYESDESMLADVGEDGTIGMLYYSPIENSAFPIVLIDNAVNRKQYTDWSNARIDSYDCIIDSQEDVQNVKEKSILGTGKAEDAQIPVSEFVNLCTKNNSDATYADLTALLSDADKISVESLGR